MGDVNKRKDVIKQKQMQGGEEKLGGWYGRRWGVRVMSSIIIFVSSGRRNTRAKTVSWAQRCGYERAHTHTHTRTHTHTHTHTPVSYTFLRSHESVITPLSFFFPKKKHCPLNLHPPSHSGSVLVVLFISSPTLSLTSRLYPPPLFFITYHSIYN